MRFEEKKINKKIFFQQGDIKLIIQYQRILYFYKMIKINNLLKYNELWTSQFLTKSDLIQLSNSRKKTKKMILMKKRKKQEDEDEKKGDQEQKSKREEKV